MHELADRVVPLDALIGTTANDLRSSLGEVDDPTAVLAQMQTWLAGQLEVAPRDFARLEVALRRLLVPGPAGIAPPASSSANMWTSAWKS